MRRRQDHLGLVGKGVTFDTGGISIKPADGMEKMKYDMGGGAAVLGAMRAIAQLKPRRPVTAFIPTVENMISGRAQRPGDIVTSLSGKTVEVLNTDAEGRLILADALTYAMRLGCTHLVDAATLTGAIVVALGHIHVGAFTNNEEFLRTRDRRRAKSGGERMWHMPLDDDYKDYLKSPFRRSCRTSAGGGAARLRRRSSWRSSSEGSPGCISISPGPPGSTMLSRIWRKARRACRSARSSISR